LINEWGPNRMSTHKLYDASVRYLRSFGYLYHISMLCLIGFGNVALWRIVQSFTGVRISPIRINRCRVTPICHVIEIDGLIGLIG